MHNVWSPLLVDCLFGKKEPSNGVDKNAVAEIQQDSCGKEEAMCHKAYRKRFHFLLLHVKRILEDLNYKKFLFTVAKKNLLTLKTNE